MVYKDYEYLILLILYIGYEARRGNVALPFSKPYNILREGGININYHRYRKIVKHAEDIGFIQILEGPLISRIVKKPSVLFPQRGRPPEKLIALTEKGEKCLEHLHCLEEAGFDKIVRKAKRILERLSKF